MMIFLDEEPFIREAIESVISQTERSWELILVDDGSRDAGTDIARDYARALPDRVRYLAHPDGGNHGLSASRNLAIRHARGEFLTSVDADDVARPGKLADHLEVFRRHPEIDVVCGAAEFWFSWSGAAGAPRDYVQGLGLPLNRRISGIELLTQFLCDEFASPCDLMVRRDTAVRVGGFEDDFRDVYEDQVFHTKLCLADAAIWVADTCGYRYRQNPEGTTAVSKHAGSYRATRQMFLDWVEQSAQQAGTREEVAAALTEARWPFEHPVRARAEDARRWLRGRFSMPQAG